MKVFPEKICVHRKGNSKICEWFNKNSNTDQDYNNSLLGWYTHYPAYNNDCHTSDSVHVGYTLISKDDFLKFIEIKNNQSEEIFSYKFKEGFENFVDTYGKICDIVPSSIDEYKRQGYVFTINSTSYNKMKEAGVLDIWFDPIY